MSNSWDSSFGIPILEFHHALNRQPSVFRLQLTLFLRSRQNAHSNRLGQK